ncbi:MAG: SAP domain-containing protein, partial [Candidatus Hydrothermarchaeaceae archaeon]
EKTSSDIKKILSTNVDNVRPRRIIEYEFRDGVTGLEEILNRTEKDLRKKKIPVLKELLRARGLKLGGKKDELVERLLADMPEEERVDTKLFVKKYEELSKTKASLHQIPKGLQRVYKRFKK